MRRLSTSAIAILAATGFVLSANAQETDQQAQQQQQQQAANGCELQFADVDQRMEEDRELRGQVSADVVRDLRSMRNAAIRLEQYGHTRACQEVVVAIHEILDDPDQLTAVDEQPVEDPDRAEAPAEEEAVAVAPDEQVEDPEVAEVEEDRDLAAAEEDPDVAEAPEQDAEDPEVTAAVPQDDEVAEETADQPTDEELAQEPRTEQDRLGAVGIREMGAQIRVNELIGTDVRGANDESIGEIDDVVLGANGEPEYVIISYGGFLGLGQDQTAVPFDRIRISPDLDVVYLPVTEAELEQAPTFQRGDDAWMQDDTWRQQADEYYQRG